MNEFKRFYLWGMNTKLYMGIYFFALVFLAGLILLCFGELSIGIVALAEMFCVAFAAAVTQTLFLPDSVDFLNGIFFGRSVIWLLLVGVITGVTAWLGAWFGTLPAWTALVMALFMMASCIAMLTGLRFEQEKDTIYLNEKLQAHNGSKE